jgi:iron-sulfur cluster assembly protein
MFKMTINAAVQIRQAAIDADAAGMALRVAARQESDGSVAYGMGFDDAQEGEEPALTMDGVTVLIAPPSRPLLEGTVLDFVELEPGEFSFIFIPPSAAASCDSSGTGRSSAARRSGGGCGGCGGGSSSGGGCGSAR